MGMTTTASGLQYEDTIVGPGSPARPGRNVVVHYTGWLYVDGQRGAKFDSSHDHGEPLIFPLGKGAVIKGWDEGVAGMQVTFVDDLQGFGRQRVAQRLLDGGNGDSRCVHVVGSWSVPDQRQISVIRRLRPASCGGSCRCPARP